VEYEYSKIIELVNKPAGYRLDINGVIWIRMADDHDSYIEGCYFNTDNGEWIHASRLCRVE